MRYFNAARPFIPSAIGGDQPFAPLHELSGNSLLTLCVQECRHSEAVLSSQLMPRFRLQVPSMRTASATLSTSPDTSSTE